MKRFLVKHVGNMGDMIFLVPPFLETLKRREPDSHVTFVTAWGFKEYRRRFPLFQKKEYWGQRNQSGFCIALMLENPHIDQLIHWHDTLTDLKGGTCIEEGEHIPTWSASYYEEQKRSAGYDAVYELDFGIGVEENPIEKMYQVAGMSEERYANYQISLSANDIAIAEQVMEHLPRPRIVLLEGLAVENTRGWDPEKIPGLERAIERTYGAAPLWFGGQYIREHGGRKLTLRENIATLQFCDVTIGVMTGPMHFAAAVGSPTIALYADMPLHRAAPAFFLNEYINDPAKKHRTLLGPMKKPYHLLKEGATLLGLTPAEQATQGYRDWNHPGRQSTKSPVAILTVDEIMKVLKDVLPV